MTAQFVKFVLGLAAVLGGASLTIKLLFGVWVPKNTHGAIVAVLTALGIMLAFVALPATLRSVEESADKAIELYEKYRNRITGYSRPKLTPYATVCTPEGGWKNLHEALAAIRVKGVTIEKEAEEVILSNRSALYSGKKCFHIHSMLDAEFFGQKSWLDRTGKFSACSLDVFLTYLYTAGDLKLTLPIVVGEYKQTSPERYYYERRIFENDSRLRRYFYYDTTRGGASWRSLSPVYNEPLLVCPAGEKT